MAISENPFEAPLAHASPSARGEIVRGADGFWVFRCSVWPVLLLAAVITSVADTIYAYFFVEAATRWSVALGMFLLTLVLQALSVLVLVRKFPIYVSEEGIRCFDLFGHYYFVAWDSIKEVRTRNHCGLRYLKLRCDGVAVQLWVPLFLQRRVEFTRFVKQHTSGVLVQHL